MQVGTRFYGQTQVRDTSASTQVGASVQEGSVGAQQIPFSPEAGASKRTQPKPTNLGALVSSGLKAAVFGVMIGAAALTGCSSSSVYQGPGYADYHRATLTWESPTSHTDGTPFRDENGDGRVDGVRGFIVYRGDQPLSTAGNYDESREITNPDCKRTGGRMLCTYAWNNLPSGTNYFSVKAFKEVTPGNRTISDYSNEASKVIP